MEVTHEVRDRRWWEAQSPEEVHGALWQGYEAAKEADRGRAESYRVLRDYYTCGVLQSDIAPASIDGAQEISQSRLNILASVQDTAVTKLLESRPNPQVLTSGGDARLQRQAAKLSKWTQGAAEAVKLHEVMAKATYEAVWVGTGAFRIFERRGRPDAEVAYCDEIFVDALEAGYDAVLTYYQERRVDRAVLLRRYPKSRQHILDAEPAPPADGDHYAPGSSDMIMVVQAWRLALSDDPRDAGSFAVATSAGLLAQEEYASEAAPFVFLRWRPRPRSFWGIGLGEMLAGAQEQVDRHSETIDETLDAMPPAIMARTGSIKRSQFDDGLARIYEYDGDPPIPWAPAAGAVQAHEARETRLVETMYHLAGVSSMEAGAQKPAGLNSGRAQLVHQDIKSQRLVMQARGVEDAYTEAFRRLIEVADAIQSRADKRGDKRRDRMRYLAGDGDELEEIAFGEARIADALYRVQVFPVSRLPDSPAGLLEFVSELVNAGIIQGDEALGLMDFPDVKALVKRRRSMTDLARLLVDKAVEGLNVTEWVTADDDLDELLSYGRQMRAQALMNGSDHEDLAVLRDVLAVAASLKTQLMAPAPAPVPPAGAQPMPGPMPGAMPGPGPMTPV